MTIRVIGAVLLLAFAAVLLSGCPKQAPPASDLPVGGPSAGTGKTPIPTPAPAGDAKQLVEQKCTQCHGMDKVEKEQKEADAEEWAKIVKQMQARALKMKKEPISDDEAQQILEYLQAPAPTPGTK
jgi:cytochrome c5